MTGGEVLEQRGAIKVRRRKLESLLQLWFGALPSALTERIWQANPEELRRWIDRVMRAASLDEVFDDPAQSDLPHA